MLECGVTLTEQQAEALIAPAASASFLRSMKWAQAIASAGAIVHDSPHEYPNNADIRETFCIPGASTLYVAFHELTVTEREYDFVVLRWTQVAMASVHG